jgi:dTDP-4-amino-4,6-dideoxygalactose transaminase
MLNISKPFLPDVTEYKNYVDQIFKSGILTNNGPLVRELEEKLSEFLGVENILLVSNGTLAIQLAFEILEIKGSVITSPFSFIASLTPILANKSQPIFVDINPKTFNLDPEKIPEIIDANVEAILPVHVFGNPCDCIEIERIAKQNKLKVIFDASHAFNVSYKGKNLLNYGDISTISFHATKIFHSIEGGALIIKDKELYEKAKCARNFGFNNQGDIECIGINAKMSEFHAAMGLCSLKEIKKNMQLYKNASIKYREELSGYVEFQEINSNSVINYSYFPILLQNESQCLRVIRSLEENQVFPRRYFHPSLDSLEFVDSKISHFSKEVSEKILCLPMSVYITSQQQVDICNLIKSAL